LRRRFKRMADDGYREQTIEASEREDENAWALIPNLIIIDGGKGQLNAALEVLDEFELRDAVAIIGLAKREEEIFLPDIAEPIVLPRNSQALFLIQRIRDEAHRFGLTYHRQLRGKSAVHSGLDEIEGIGPKRRRALLKKFGSLEAIRKASIEDLISIPGMTRTAAEKLKEEL
jgi:excinuclease ABC subunit C